MGDGEDSRRHVDGSAVIRVWNETSHVGHRGEAEHYVTGHVAGQLVVMRVWADDERPLTDEQAAALVAVRMNQAEP